MSLVLHCILEMTMKGCFVVGAVLLSLTSSVCCQHQSGPRLQLASGEVVAARRITCDPRQPGMNTVFSISLIGKSSNAEKFEVLRVYEEVDPKMNLKNPVTNAMLLVSFSNTMHIDVFLLQCNCDPSPGRSLCPNPALSKLNFTCIYHFSGNDGAGERSIRANVSDVNMTSVKCCTSEPCAGENVGTETVRLPHGHTNQSEDFASQRSDDAHTYTALVVLVCLLSLALVMAILACIYLWRKCRQLQKSQQVKQSLFSSEGEELTGNEGNRKHDADRESCSNV